MKFTPQMTIDAPRTPKKSRIRLHPVEPSVMKNAAHVSDPMHRYHTPSQLGDMRPGVSRSGMPQRTRARHSHAY